MNNTKYWVSICVPIYGVEKYIERCAISMFEQTYPNIEYIFVNDNTPDKSIEILESVIERYPNRKPYVRIIAHEKNLGLAAARNTAVDVVTKEFLMHVDSDDWISQNCVELCVEKQKENDADIVNFDAIKFMQKKHQVLKHSDIISPKELTIEILRRNESINIWGRLIRTDLYKSNAIKNKEGVDMAEDYQIIPKLMYKARRIAVLHKPLYYYNAINENSYSYTFSQKKTKQIWETIDILKDYFYENDIKFINALSEGSLKIYCDNLINACKAKDDMCIIEVRNRINKIDAKYKKCLPIRYRICLEINNINLLMLYVNISTQIWYLLKRIKNIM